MRCFNRVSKRRYDPAAKHNFIDKRRLTVEFGSIAQPLCSIPLSRTSSLLRAVPPLKLRIRTLALVVLPLVASPFASESQVPTFRLTASWQAQATSHAGCRSARKQISSELVP